MKLREQIDKQSAFVISEDLKKNVYFLMFIFILISLERGESQIEMEVEIEREMPSNYGFIN